MTAHASANKGPRALRLQSKGALRSDALYVERLADSALHQALRRGEFCYVLAPRQIGKSSLRLHVARKLFMEDGVRCAHLDLSEMGDGDGEDGKSGWYFGLLQKIASDLNLDDPLEFFRSRQQEQPVSRFRHYLREVVLSAYSEQIVIFVDEIDYVRKLRQSFDTDEFFATIRGIANARAEDPGLNRLTFCLLGVAAPSDLIADPAVTPFNVGQAISLADFSRQELEAFAPQLQSLPGSASEWLDAIYSWTSGQPYMTQTLLEQAQHSLRKTPLTGSVSDFIAALVRERFLLRGRAEDPNLAYAETRLDASPRKADLLSVYQRLLSGKLEPARTGDVVKLELELCGLAVTKEQPDGSTVLFPRSRIFTSVFDSAWVRSKQAQHRWTEALHRWIAAGKPTTGVLAGLLGGPDLVDLEVFARKQPGVLSGDEQEYLLASLAAERRMVTAQASSDRARLQRRILILLSIALIIVSGLLILAFMQYRRAEREYRIGREALQQETAARKEAEAAQKLAETSALSERSLRAASLALKPGMSYQALVMGLTVAASDLRSSSFDPVHWEGLTLAATQAVAGTTLFGHTGSVNAVSVSQDGKRILTGSSDGTARIWDAATAGTLGVLAGQKQAIFAASLSPDGRQAVTGGEGGEARIWDCSSQKNLLTLKGHNDIILSVSYSPDGKRVITGSGDRTARIWDAKTGGLLAVLKGHRLAVGAVSYSPDGQEIATGSFDATVRIFDAQSGRLLRELNGHTYRIFTVAWSPDGRRLLSGSFDGTARIWDLMSGKTVQKLTGHYGMIFAAAYSPDGQQVATGAQDGTVRLWDAESGRTLRVIEGHRLAVLGLGYSPDGRRLVTGSDDETARIWNLAGPGSSKTLRVLGGHNSFVLTGAISQDWRQILTGSYDQTARIWNIKDTANAAPMRVLIGQGSGVRSAAFSADGEQVVTGGEGGAALLWRAPGSGMLNARTVLKSRGGTVYAVAFSPDGKQVLTGTAHGPAEIWDTSSGKRLLELSGETLEGVGAAAYSPDGRQLVTGSPDGSAWVWDGASGKALLPLGSHHQAVLVAAYSPSGEQIATGSKDGTLRISDARSGKEELSLRSHGGSLRSLAYTVDGRRIIGGCQDGTVRVWDSRSGQELLSLPTLGDPLLSALPSRDGKTLLVVSADAAHRVYLEEFLVDPPALYAYGCRVLRGFAANGIPNVAEKEVRQALAACAP